MLGGIDAETSDTHVDQFIEVVGHLHVRPVVRLASEQQVVEADEVTVPHLIYVTVVVDSAIG